MRHNHQCSNCQRINRNDGFPSVQTTLLSINCKRNAGLKKLFLHKQCPVLFRVEFWKQQISSNDIRSSNLCIPLWDNYSMNIFSLFLQTEGKKEFFQCSNRYSTVWPNVLIFPAFPELQQVFLLSSHRDSTGGTLCLLQVVFVISFL